MPCWLLVLLFSAFLIVGTPLEENSVPIILGSSIFALALSWVALKGYVPMFLLRIFTRGISVADKKDLR